MTTKHLRTSISSNSLQASSNPDGAILDIKGQEKKTVRAGDGREDGGVETSGEYSPGEGGSNKHNYLRNGRLGVFVMGPDKDVGWEGSGEWKKTCV
jgi:hypothetical protein